MAPKRETLRAANPPPAGPFRRLVLGNCYYFRTRVRCCLPGDAFLERTQTVTDDGVREGAVDEQSLFDLILSSLPRFSVAVLSAIIFSVSGRVFIEDLVLWRIFAFTTAGGCVAIWMADAIKRTGRRSD